MAGNRGIRKIQSTRGASLAIGLVYFLICATVGSVVLAAAMANISHVKSEKVNEGSYLAVMSAGMALKEQLEGSARECSVAHGQQDTPADESQRADFKGGGSCWQRPVLRRQAPGRRPPSRPRCTAFI